MNNLKSRGLIQDISGELESALNEPITFYVGFDPTADSLHLGNLLPIVLMRRLQDMGHAPVVLVGGATGMIGDPSGKSQERKLLGMQDVMGNADAIQKQLEKFLLFSGINGARMVNNAEWFQDMPILEFLRNVGKHVSVNQMLSRDSVKGRLKNESGISFTEFTYQLLQAYDFVHLCMRHNCTLQIGGSDQWGNITAGIQLARKMLSRVAHGLTHPLLVTSEGKKFGKSEGNAIWLDSKKTSPYKMYQYLLNQSDEDVKKLLLYLTFISLEDVDALMDAHFDEPENRAAQKRLAHEVVSFVHSIDDAKKSEKISGHLFSESFESISTEEMMDSFDGQEWVTISKNDLQSGVMLLDFIASSNDVSKSRIREMIDVGAIKINGKKVFDSKELITVSDVLSNGFIVIKKGKKSFIICRVI